MEHILLLYMVAQMIKWIDMIDPVYTLVRMCDLDPESITITSIFIGEHMLIIRYLDENGVLRHVSQKYDL